MRKIAVLVPTTTVREDLRCSFYHDARSTSGGLVGRRLGDVLALVVPSAALLNLPVDAGQFFRKMKCAPLT